MVPHGTRKRGETSFHDDRGKGTIAENDAPAAAFSVEARSLAVECKNSRLFSLSLVRPLAALAARVSPGASASRVNSRALVASESRKERPRGVKETRLISSFAFSHSPPGRSSLPAAAALVLTLSFALSLSASLSLPLASKNQNQISTPSSSTS